MSYIFFIIDVIGVLREWGPLENKGERVQGCNPEVRKIVIADMRYFIIFYTILFFHVLSEKLNQLSTINQSQGYKTEHIIVGKVCFDVQR